ncbi:hypothetical protein Q7C18_07520 [Nesterenkonia sp. CL21]|uniref:hypothetical protein n=1 Tax=Nesterenkonia sp. CL21 TaxID=3064894 RepID=UPI0028790DD0|nr:hypothetical protein [Nesterenkonia sp. CL21]MDS2172538.1 hypothetical protein [Nesterenkonia sp. CL21]
MASLIPFAREQLLGEIDDLFEASEQGLLWESSDDPGESIKPIHTHPEVYELRLTFMSRHVRFYHAEPSREPALLLSLHRHVKPGVQAAQAAIDDAVEVYRGYL